MNFSKKQIEAMIAGIEDGSINELNLPVDYYNALVEHLTKAVYKGFNATLDTVSRLDLPLLEELTTNVYMFGAAKTFQQTVEISSLLVDEEGNVRSSRDFNRLARETYDNWNDNWGRTEYNTAIGQADMAAKWAEIDRQKDIMPNLEYSAVMDPNTSEICAPLDGIIAPVDDPIWDKVMPLNHFNCFTPDTKVLAPSGWVAICDISVGDLVIGGSGDSHYVTAVHVNSLNDKLVHISIKGSSVTATKNHRFLTLDGWKVAGNISTGDIVVQNVQKGTLNKLVCAVKNLYTIAGYFLMPVHGQGETGPKALNSDVVVGQQNVNKATRKANEFIAKASYSSVGQIVAKALLMLCQWLMILPVALWILVVGLNRFFVRPLSNFHIKHGIIFSHTISSIRSFFTQSPVWGRFANMAQIFRGPVSSIIGIDPLRFHRLASLPCFQSVEFKQPYEGTGIDTPQGSNFTKGHHVGVVSNGEGFTAGAPLDKFNSFDSLLLHAFFHRKLRRVKGLTEKEYQGQIYNLSVNTDESYITNVGVVHNCRCVVLQTDDPATPAYAQTADGVIDTMQDVFKNNPGKSGEIFTKDHPYFEVSNQYREWAKQNFGLELPKFTKTQEDQ